MPVVFERGLARNPGDGGQFSGPLDVGGAKIVNPPALKIAMQISSAYRRNGLAVDDAWKAARKDEVAAYAHATPDILITEAFPFGRRRCGRIDPLLSLPIRPNIARSSFALFGTFCPNANRGAEETVRRSPNTTTLSLFTVIPDLCV